MGQVTKETKQTLSVLHNSTFQEFLALGIYIPQQSHKRTIMTSYEILSEVPNFSQSWQYEKVMAFPGWDLLKNRTVRKYIYYNNTWGKKRKRVPLLASSIFFIISQLRNTLKSPCKTKCTDSNQKKLPIKKPHKTIHPQMQNTDCIMEVFQPNSTYSWH